MTNGQAQTQTRTRAVEAGALLGPGALGRTALDRILLLIGP